jgi:hypothetical protein
MIGLLTRAPTLPGSQQKEHIHTRTKKTGRANFTTVEEILTGKEVLASTTTCVSILLSFYSILELPMIL